MSALIDIVITFIAAMLSAAFVHFGAHSEKPRPAPASPPPAEQTRQAYEPAHYETVSDETVEPVPPAAPKTEAISAPVDVRVDPVQVEAEYVAREQIRIQAQSPRMKDREIRRLQNRERARLSAH